ncbi:hypothetical protein ERJ75_001190900 [Trypanosoma vivax]|uniref:RNA-editing substrate-binding complex 6 protein domain-containing protein n=1 Tax=Trypanosoma vivax (strain Y486) TaxID=1055687 RepID=G0UBX5_TRYVY|nr:hypothetical protein TRVL_05353 [Trypanosoma vivax]KAH8609466.1 hypothetical protein ERJ75_001190900 [Trypanosoma vivax]CCC53323.1 conserved hypothetical protein [Trypanosoma vivax Y486]
MNGKLCGLLQRLASPIVATRLAKEELCLSMSAIARLRLRKDQIGFLRSTDTLSTRAHRISALCTPTELAMLAEGADAIASPRMDLADALIDEMYEAVRTAKPARIAHVVSVVQYSAGIELYLNETVAALLRSGAKLLHKSDGATVLTHYVQLSESRLPVEAFHGLMEELRAKATEGQRLTFLKAKTGSSGATIGQGSGSGLDGDAKALAEDHALVEDEEEGEEKEAWTAPRARRWMSQWANGGGPWKPSEAIQAVELYTHFAVRDFILHEKIQEITLSVIPSATKYELEEIRKTVLSSCNVFALLRDTLTRRRDAESGAPVDGAGSTHSEGSCAAVTEMPASTRAYNLVTAGRRVPEDLMFEVVKEQSCHTPVDVAAQAGCIFVERGEIPEGVLLQLSAERDKLGPQGVVALVRLARRDSTGAVLPLCAAVLHRFAAEGIQGAAVETVLELCENLALPLPRGLREEDLSQLRGAEEMLREALSTRLLAVVRGGCDLRFQCRVAKAALVIDTNNELVQFVCSAVCARGQPLSVEQALLLLDLLCKRDFIHEPVVDVMEVAFRGLVESVVARMEASKEVPSEDVRYIAHFAAMQAEFDVPDFDPVALFLLRAVERDPTRVPTEMLPAVGLLCLRGGRHDTVAKIQNHIIKQVGTLSVNAVGELAQLLMVAGHNTVDELVDELHSAVTGILVREGNLLAEDVAKVAAACCRRGKAVDERVVDYLLNHMSALSSHVYTDLCRFVHLTPSPPLLANSLVDDFPRRLDLLSPGEIAEVAFGLGEVAELGQRLSHQLATERCSDYVIDHSQVFWRGMDVARLLYGFSRMHCTKRSLYNVFATRLAHRPILSTMGQEAISIAIAAFGRAKYLDKKLFDKFSRRMLAQTDALGAAELLFTIRGFSRVMLLNDRLYDELGARAAEKVKEFPVDSKCVLLNSYGSLGVTHPELATKMLSGIVESLSELKDANKAVGVIASLWQMHHSLEGDEHVATLTDWIVDRAHELDEEAIGKLCVVMRETNWRNVPLLRAVAEQSVRLQRQENISPNCCRAVLDTLGTFMLHHQGARENLSALARSVSKERIQLSEEEEQHLQLLLQR